MSAIQIPVQESSPGVKARKLRLAEHITRRQLALLADVSVEAVDLFEHGLPLPLDYKRRILRALWAKYIKR
jgi:transcriptional regulator with XRE-family HTH domain